MTTDRSITDADIASSLSGLTESTTAAELVRRQGQTRKVKVVSERKLMEWILALVKQHMAEKEDSFSDQEKAELLRKTQDELAKRIQRQQTAEREQAQVQERLEQAMAQLATAQTGQDKDNAVEAMRARLAEAEDRSQDLQQDNFELTDQLQEKLALLSTTINEKNKLRDTVRQQMIRSGQLVEGVFHLDQICYGGRHVTESPANEEASAEERFFHDFAIGGAIIGALGEDLERMRGPSTPHLFLDQDSGGLIEQVGQAVQASAHAAGPIGDLVSALESARDEVLALHRAVAQATGLPGVNLAIPAIPEADEEMGLIVQGAVTILREVAGELNRSRGRIAAVKNIADEADAARNQVEQDLDVVRQGSEQLLATLALLGQQRRLPQDRAIDDTTVSLPERIGAATALINALADAGLEDPEVVSAIDEQEQRAERLAQQAGLNGPAGTAGTGSRANRLRTAGDSLESLVRAQERLLEAAATREKALSEQIQLLGQLRGGKGELKDFDKEIGGAKTVRLTDAPAKEAIAHDDVRSIEKLVAYSKQQAAALANATAERDQAKKNLAAVTELLRSAQAKIEELRDARKK